MHEVALFFRPILAIDLKSNLLRLLFAENWLEFVAHGLAPKQDGVDLPLTDPALILVVRFAGHCIFGAFIPLAAAWLFRFVAKHSLEDKLIID